jgi:hypothetical protein
MAYLIRFTLCFIRILASPLRFLGRFFLSFIIDNICFPSLKEFPSSHPCPVVVVAEGGTGIVVAVIGGAGIVLVTAAGAGIVAVTAVGDAGIVVVVAGVVKTTGSRDFKMELNPWDEFI